MTIREDSLEASEMDLFIGRQPIFDPALQVMGYELLYRGGLENQASFSNPDYATMQVLLNAFTELGLENIVGKKKAFVNFTRNFFLQKHPIPFRPDQLVLEVPENIVLDNDMLNAIRDLKLQGFEIAMDDLTGLRRILPVLPFVDYLKFDLRAMTERQLKEIIALLPRLNIKLLAEKVETAEEVQYYQKLGFHYFQGYFLARPEVVQGRKLPPSSVAVLQLIQKLQQPDVNFRDLDEFFAQDASLGYKLLRLVNSSFYGLPVKVESINQAITILGIEELRKWLVLILLSKAANKPRETTVMTMVRAKMCDRIAFATQQNRPETFFLVGLLSMLDALMDLPMTEVVASLPLSEEITGALLHRRGDMGEALSCTIAYERGDWARAKFQGLSAGDLRNIFVETLDWVNRVTAAVGI